MVRSYICPGAGFALLGRAALAASTFATSVGLILAVMWLSFQPGVTAVWTVLGLFALAGTLWVAEQIAANRATLRSPGPSFLTTGFPVAATATCLGVAAALVFLLTNFGSLMLAGTGMSPTLVKGERVLYHNHVDPERLRRGAVIVYKLSDRSAWGQPGWLVISRILAVSGDRLSIQGGKYLINGEVGPAVAETGHYTPVVVIPATPDTLTVPENCYFVVQDSPKGGFDSRVLSWVQAQETVSTRLYYLSNRSFLETVE
jgi:signal peptidase I